MESLSLDICYSDIWISVGLTGSLKHWLLTTEAYCHQMMNTKMSDNLTLL